MRSYLSPSPPSIDSEGLTYGGHYHKHEKQQKGWRGSSVVESLPSMRFNPGFNIPNSKRKKKKAKYWNIILCPGIIGSGLDVVSFLIWTTSPQITTWKLLIMKA